MTKLLSTILRMESELLPDGESKHSFHYVAGPYLEVDNSKLLPLFKALIAPARFSDGPTLYQICKQHDAELYEIHESLPTGEVKVWPEPPIKGPHQAEAFIYTWREEAATKAAVAEWEAMKAKARQEAGE